MKIYDKKLAYPYFVWMVLFTVVPLFIAQKGCISDRQQETCHTCKSYKCSYYQIGHCYDQTECDTCDHASNSSMYFIAS